MAKVNVRALVFGAIVFVAIRLVGDLALNVGSDPRGSPTIAFGSGLVFAYGFLMYLVPGFVTGLVSGRAPFVHGFLLAIICSILLGPFLVVLSFGETMARGDLGIAILANVPLATVSCWLGAILGVAVASRPRAP